MLGCGQRKVWLDPNEVNDISMANSRECQRQRGEAASVWGRLERLERQQLWGGGRAVWWPLAAIGSCTADSCSQWQLEALEAWVAE